MFSEAIDHFRTAMALDPSSITLRDIEQLANLLSRQALASQLEVPRGGKDKARKARLAAAEADIDEAISLLKWLVDTPSCRKNVGEKKKGASAHEAPGKTSERYSLLGSAYKRKAWISANLIHAGQMKQAYEKACSLAGGEEPASIPNLNQLFTEVILSWDNKRKRQRKSRFGRTGDSEIGTGATQPCERFFLGRDHVLRRPTGLALLGGP
jgi:hypothetical protein